MILTLPSTLWCSWTATLRLGLGPYIHCGSRSSRVWYPHVTAEVGAFLGLMAFFLTVDRDVSFGEQVRRAVRGGLRCRVGWFRAPGAWYGAGNLFTRIAAHTRRILSSEMRQQPVG